MKKIRKCISAFGFGVVATGVILVAFAVVSSFFTQGNVLEIKEIKGQLFEIGIVFFTVGGLIAWIAFPNGNGEKGRKND